MLTWRRIVLRYQSISWILIAGYFVLVFFPAHLHYHNENGRVSVIHENLGHLAAAHEPGSHKHETGLNVLTDLSIKVHHSWAHVFKASPDVLTRKPRDNPTPAPLFILLLIFLPIFVKQKGPRPHGPASFVCRPRYHLTPPLRAPPGC
jgi:hypothetical protein